MTINLGNATQPAYVTYGQLRDRINSLESNQEVLLENVDLYENRSKNEFNYALELFAPQPEQPGEDTGLPVESGVGTAVDVQTLNENQQEAVSLLEDIDNLGLDENYVKTLERLDISALEADALGENPAEQLDPIVSTLNQISGLIEPSSDFTERRYTSEEQTQLKSSVDALVDELEKLGVDVAGNEALQLLDTLSIDARGNIRSDDRVLDDTREADVDNLRRLQNRLERVQGRTRIKPEVNLARQRIIQGKIDPIEERLSSGAYLDEILQLIGE